MALSTEPGPVDNTVYRVFTEFFFGFFWLYLLFCFRGLRPVGVADTGRGNPNETKDKRHTRFVFGAAEFHRRRPSISQCHARRRRRPASRGPSIAPPSAPERRRRRRAKDGSPVNMSSIDLQERPDGSASAGHFFGFRLFACGPSNFPVQIRSKKKTQKIIKKEKLGKNPDKVVAQ